MKLYILDTGYLETDKNNIIAGATVGTRTTPNVKNEWIKLPVMAFLIDTGKGFILYDTGSNPEGMNGYWQKAMQEIYPLFQTTEQRLENQLKLCGVKPEDIHTVVLSHMHLDHAGNLQLFKHATVYAPKADFMNAQTAVHLSPDPETHGGYIRGDMDVPIRYVLVDGDNDFEICPGVEVINLPGHTAGLLGLVVHLPSQTIILPQDCIYSPENYGPPLKMSGLYYDSFAFPKSIEKVRKIANKHNAKVIFAHDYEFFKTLKTAPEYYE